MQHLPEQYVLRAKNYFGDDYTNFIASLSQPASLSIRLNSEKINHHFGHFVDVPWCDEGKYLDIRPDFTLDPLFHAGTYYVQEASSMFIAHIVKHIFDLSQSLNVLDLCAAPGGKSTLLSSLLSDESLLIANEVIAKRVGMLSENISKWGKPNTLVSNNDPNDLKKLNSFFDLVVVDAPCSGEGLFRKDHDAINEWSVNNIQLCEARQKRILEAIQKTIANDGYLIFCTCTFAPEENEENLKWFIENNPEYESVQIPINKNWGIVQKTNTVKDQQLFSYHFYPHKVKGEGFFVTCLKKALSPSLPNQVRDKLSPKGEGKHSKLKKHVNFQLLQEKEKNILKNWIKNFEQYEFYLNWENELYAIHKEKTKEISLLMQTFKIKQAGIHIGKLIKNELIPSHHLAVSTIISNEIPFIELNKQQALQYLAKQNITAISTDSVGWHLVKYNGVNLGWVKMLPNRINNYYPQEYRIRKSIEIIAK